jgi:hypothetical protein
MFKTSGNFLILQDGSSERAGNFQDFRMIPVSNLEVSKRHLALLIL